MEIIFFLYFVYFSLIKQKIGAPGLRGEIGLVGAPGFDGRPGSIGEKSQN